MGLTLADRQKGGREVARLKGSAYMAKIGKKGRKKQLRILAEKKV